MSQNQSNGSAAAVAPEQYAFMGMQSGHNAAQFGDTYPHLMWLNGKQELKQLGGVAATGGFVFKFDQDPEFPVGELKEHVFSGGDSEQIFDIGAAHICVIASRIDWYHGTREEKVWLPKYEKNAKGRNRWLVLLKGAEEWHKANGPLMLTMYGVNGVLMAREVVQEFGRIRNKVGAMLKKKLDDYTFWMPVVPGPAQKASDQYTTKITPPTLNFSTTQKTVLQDLSDLYIGDDMMTLCASLWEEAQEWATKPLDAADEGDEASEYGSAGNGYGSSGTGPEEGPRPDWGNDGPPFDEGEYDDIPF